MIVVYKVLILLLLLLLGASPLLQRLPCFIINPRGNRRRVGGWLVKRRVLSDVVPEDADFCLLVQVCWQVLPAYRADENLGVGGNSARYRAMGLGLGMTFFMEGR